MHRKQLLTGFFILFSPVSLYSQVPETGAGTDWPMYRGSLDGSGYSALAEITPQNVARLETAWTYSLGTAVNDRAAAPNSQATPIVVDGVMYLPAADRVVALNPQTGAELWRYPVTGGRPSRRGVAYWPGSGDQSARIVFTAGSRLLALDAATGEPAAEFGNNGAVDLVVPYLSVPLVYENLIVVGANTPPGAAGGIGNPRAYDARSGAKLWEFSSVPQPGQTGHESWVGDSWVDRLGANAWPFYFTMDRERELLYLPLASPIPFAYGGDRGGSNLFANSIVAVDIHSGDYVWHFQTIHHDLWDHDPPAPPTLFDIEDADGLIPALAVTTKSGYLFILNRETGEPVYPVTERQVPASEVPGEKAYPTQPIPAVTPPMARVNYSPADLVSAADTSLEHATACAELAQANGVLVNAGPYTPWVYRSAGTAERTTLLFPGLGGGPNWGGVAYDPGSRLAFVFAADVGTLGWVEAAGADAELPFQLSGPRPSSFQVQINGQSLPCQQPPWGRLTAVDTESGEVVWQQAVGISESLPAGRQNTGRPGRASALVTASNLLFIASTDDNRFRALETGSGRQLWETTLNGRGNANPMTYLGSDNRQYLAITATSELVVYRLP
ncbi:MAG: PQQ-binding-like beta-propeller repeat protein [Gammaproteobacteria bacterium]|nr:PQQ-binding-like beta-propeller repeat protein [Pseudomonadales bacterium]